MAMTSHTPAPSPTADPAPDIRPGRRHRARWGWLGLAGVALIVNVALVTSLIMGRSPGSAAGDPSSPSASDARSPLDAVHRALGARRWRDEKYQPRDWYAIRKGLVSNA